MDIEDHDKLYRRIHLTFFRKDGSVSANAFITNKVPDYEISVDLARLTTPEEASMRGRKPPYAIGCFQYKFARGLGFVIEYHPLPDNDEPETINPAHCLLLGENDPDKCDDLAEEADKCVYFRPRPRTGA